MDHPNPAVGNQDAEYGKWEVTKVRSATTKPCQRLAVHEAMTFGSSRRRNHDHNFHNQFTTCSTKRLYWKKTVTLSLHFLQGRHASHEPAAPSSKSGWSVWFETPGTSIYMQTADPSIWANSWSAVFTTFCSGSTVLSNQINPNYVTILNLSFFQSPEEPKKERFV